MRWVEAMFCCCLFWVLCDKYWPLGIDPDLTKGRVMAASFNQLPSKYIDTVVACAPSGLCGVEQVGLECEFFDPTWGGSVDDDTTCHMLHDPAFGFGKSGYVVDMRTGSIVY